MVYVDIEKCIGCGTCAQACPVAAISLVGGTAQVDQEKCTDCEACVEVCPNGAMLAVREPVAERVAVPSVRPAPEAIRVRPQPVPVSLRARLVPFVGSALALLGRNIAPRLATYLVNALDRQLSGQAGFTARGRGFRRRRRRGRGGQ
ncbi:MAG: 4Fe-4S dicluster domain-containing protein [Chloroflexi bacterium]|nr:4Fe-4S dicluster domain-containing protein [Chloroflexota bacterium]